jgi:hypothetical protein
MSILYVTSFTPDMYAATGARLLRSFLQTESDGMFLICTEGDFGSKDLELPDRVLRYDLDKSSFLEEWLSSNRDIIPVWFGGTAVRCCCPEGTRTGRHEPGCVFQWYNRYASRWFRKIVALDVALSYARSGTIVWLDSDCRFLRRLPEVALSRLFGGASVIFHKGPDRPVIESGVIAFDLERDGRRLLHAVIERYRTGLFRGDPRWDDGYQFQIVIESHPDVMSRDLGGRATPRGIHGHVLPNSPLGKYIEHNKGVHGKLNRIQ